MKKALLVIDYTNDFIALDGALSCGQPGLEIEDKILSLIEEYFANGDYVIFPTDCHQANDPYHPETKLFAPHNLQGSKGQQLYGKIGTWFAQHQDSPQVYYFDKNRYSSFQNTNLDNFLRERQVNELCLTGVCSDICVLHTAISAYNLNYQLVIPKDGIASFDPDGHQWALRHFQNALGAQSI
ncbi:cysteine hydrolase family protein [Ligilactobacillus sp. Marseille-Q7487]|jgi:nicotinamidase-related amidase|uniref:cysteine hydrolase family protein n=1 Tax=Ligilactobacillus sp. Marseille-Q7487 TaxID=3022128 RepID=UPI0015B4AD44|nr:cysteine hydrolase family protein [Ligilactobacillus sp. Marseille-Q7487]